jgi:putative restriction endonuclease
MYARDAQVRSAAFAFLTDYSRRAGDGGLRREVLQIGFSFEGARVPLLGPPGIFKPRILQEVPLSITTVPVVEGEARPYDDIVRDDGLLRYRYRGNDPRHLDNVGLRLAMQRQVPLVYFHGVVPGLYQAAWPVYIVGDDPAILTFTVSVDEQQFANLGDPTVVEDQESGIRRRYATRQFQQRLHQSAFRELVLRAYQRHCGICKLRHDQLLEAAHIVPDRDSAGEPVVSNGIALCKLHHAAFDANLMGITPDYIIKVHHELLQEIDGPMLMHGLQGFHDAQLRVPRRESWRPSRAFLEDRFALFKKAG